MNTFLLLHYKQNGEDWLELKIEKEEIIIGRGEDADLQVEDTKISRNHLKIIREENSIWILDLNSTNGTSLEGEMIQPGERVLLEPGQEVQVGNLVLKIQIVQPQNDYLTERHAPLDPDAGKTIERDSQERLGSDLKRSDYLLNYRKGEGPWNEVPLPIGEIIIGRYIESDLFFDDHKISRRHAKIITSENTIILQDLGSTNGTQVDGKPLSPRKSFVLNEDHSILIGSYDVKITKKKEIDKQPKTIIGDLKDFISQEDKRALQGSKFDLRSLDFESKERITIGRISDNDIILDHPLVSRYHALIEKMGTRFRLTDLKSTNGVFVNGRRIDNDAWLTDGDTITVGATDFVLTGSNLLRQAEYGLQLEAHNLNQYVSPELNLLKDINLSIKPMEFVALVGMSGAGKTTLLNAISGYWPASDGQVLINGIPLYDNYDYFRNNIGYVPQKDIVHAELTPASALDYVAQLRLPPDTTPAERSTLVDEVLTNLDILERRDVPISKLSGGQLKRVSIGVELLTKPRLFFLDEPTSGLDPGTEYEMMKLLRRLADQGRTVMLVTHATKNVMLCDKVIFLARGGHLAFFGPPEIALEYFNEYRTTREQREKPMEFDDIYIVLNDEKRGTPEDWGQRFRKSKVYLSQQSENTPLPTPQHPTPLPPKRKTTNISSLRQFKILSARNLNILLQDKVSLALMLAIAPVLGIMDFIWGADLFDPLNGDATKIITMWFMASLTTVLVGVISSVREIVKENEIYKRERAVNLKIAPYVLSKVWVGFVLALYQAGVLLIFKVLFVRPDLPSAGSFVALYITFFLSTVCGYFIGLAMSAGAPNQNAAMMLIILVLVPQFLFAGALLPLDLIPGGKTISILMPTRWSFEALVRISSFGDQLADDACWALEEESRNKLSSEEKASCPCMGASIFTDCATFPGILSKDFYNEEAKTALISQKPEEPEMPTPYPSLTPLPTPTHLPSPTPEPTPQNLRNMSEYMDLQREQGKAYQDEIMVQMEEYREDSEEQGQFYSDIRSAQGDEYQAFMREYGDERAEWQKNREKAISSAEGVLENIFDNYEQAFKGSVAARWLIILAIMLVLTATILIFQKRKDVV